MLSGAIDGRLADRRPWTIARHPMRPAFFPKTDGTIMTSPSCLFSSSSSQPAICPCASGIIESSHLDRGLP